MKKIENRGGVRAGAGRPALSDALKQQHRIINIRFTKNEFDKIEKLSEGYRGIATYIKKKCGVKKMKKLTVMDIADIIIQYQTIGNESLDGIIKISQNKYEAIIQACESAKKISWSENYDDELEQYALEQALLIAKID